MFTQIPTYLVTIGNQRWRVSKDHLEGFLHVLVFNACAKFEVVLEANPLTQQQQAIPAGSRANQKVRS